MFSKLLDRIDNLPNDVRKLQFSCDVIRHVLKHAGIRLSETEKLLQQRAYCAKYGLVDPDVLRPFCTLARRELKRKKSLPSAPQILLLAIENWSHCDPKTVLATCSCAINAMRELYTNQDGGDHAAHEKLSRILDRTEKTE